MLKFVQILISPSAAQIYRCKPHAGAVVCTPCSTSSAILFIPKTVSFNFPRSSASPPTRCRFIFDSQKRPVATACSPSSKMEENLYSSASSISVQSAGSIFKIKFCQWCGGRTKHDVPAGEEKIRAICTLCGRITYQNPKMVVGCLIEHDGKVLLCKRNIEPSFGLWTLPAGFLEIGESAAEGAIRETWEEAGAEVEVVSPFAQLDIPLISQTYIIFFARLKKPHFSPGPESSECRLFSLEDIPFETLAFSSILASLNLYVEDVRNGKLKFHYGTINKRPGSTPSDIRAYTLDNHLLPGGP